MILEVLKVGDLRPRLILNPNHQSGKPLPQLCIYTIRSFLKRWGLWNWVDDAFLSNNSVGRRWNYKEYSICITFMKLNLLPTTYSN